MSVIFNNSIYGEGGHTLVIPEGTLAFYDDTYNELSAPLNKEITITYTLSKSYAYDVIIEGDDVPANAGIDFEGLYYGNGSTIVAVDEITEENFEVRSADDYTTTVSITEGAITVVYKNFNHAISEHAYDCESYWTTFCSTKPFTLAEDLTPYIVVKGENGVNALKEIETMTAPGASATLDFGEGEVYSPSKTNGYLYSYSGNNDIYVYASNFKLESSYLNSSNTDVTLEISYSKKITNIEITPYGYGYGADVSFDGGTSVAVTDEPYSYSPNATSCSITLHGNGYQNVYIKKIVIETEGETAAPIIPAGAGILVKSAEPKEKLSYTHVNTTTISDLSGNLLVGCTKDATWNEEDKSYFKLAWASSAYDDLGFYWGVEGGASINAQAGRAYLVLPAGQAASSSRAAFLFGGAEQPTGIDSIETISDDAPIFNLQGKRVSRENLPAGVYVKNGCKFIVK